jgi:site-specific recombinase XerD
MHLLAALTPPNRLALEISLATGLRISDVLELRTADLERTQRPTVTALKTGKSRRIYIPDELHRRALLMAGRRYIFAHRHDWRRHRTRQAVYKDIKRIAAMYRLQANVAPHTARKVWAVEQYHKDGDLKRVQKLLQHDSEAVTMIYALADELVTRHRRG